MSFPYKKEKIKDKNTGVNMSNKLFRKIMKESIAEDKILLKLLAD